LLTGCGGAVDQRHHCGEDTLRGSDRLVFDVDVLPDRTLDGLASFEPAAHLESLGLERDAFAESRSEAVLASHRERGAVTIDRLDAGVPLEGRIQRPVGGGIVDVSDQAAADHRPGGLNVTRLDRD
jgi:hypothetical protein